MSKKSEIKSKTLLKIIQLAKPFRGLFLLTAFLAIVLAPLATLRPTLVKTIVDDYIFKNDIPGLTKMTLVLVGVLLLETILQLIFQYTTSWLGQMVVRDLRVNVFNKITGLKLSYFDQTPIGTSTTRTINDIETIKSVFSDGVMTILADLLTLISVIAVMLHTSWDLTLVCMAVLPFLLAASYWFKREVKKSFEEVRNQIAKMNAFLQERISGMRIIQIFNAENEDARKFKQINYDYTGANIRAIFAYAVFFPVVEIISAAALALMVWYGTRGVILSYTTLGTLVAFPLYIGMLFRPIRMLADKFNTLQMGMVAAGRVFEILESKDSEQNNGTFKKEKLNGSIDFEAVSFSYNKQDITLDQVSFHVKPLEKLAIVGSTGSGKSTIINLINRFYQIESGTINIDGVNIYNYDLNALRSRVAIVLQDVFLFTGSILDNITLRNAAISKEKAIEAATLIGAHEFIMKMPGGYDFQVMERGATLSMGQRQLISFVRALVFDPDILILDEATSSIDPESEAIIQYAIEKLIAKRTAIIIAHRLSTIRHADQIIVLEKGKIIEKGTHDELLNIKDGKYYELVQMQYFGSETAV